MASDTGGRQASRDLEQLWREYQASGDTRVRDRIVLSLCPLVEHVARTKTAERSAYTDLDGCITSGLAAALAAIDAWEPSQGETLVGLVWIRVHQAVLRACADQSIRSSV